MSDFIINEKDLTEAPVAVALERTYSSEAERSRLVGVTFVWPYLGTIVLVTGTFFNWRNSISLRRDCDSISPSEDVFSTVLYLPPGKYEYKFIVDGAWHYDPHQPFVSDELGNLNNMINIKPLSTTLVR